MSLSSFDAGLPVFRLRKGAVDCDENAPRVADVDLLETYRDAGARERWRAPPLAELESPLNRAYRRRIDATDKLAALGVVARALNGGELARAQIATLLLRLPDPRERETNASEAHALDKALHDNGWLLKDWDPDAHPRAGVAPNPGWFAPQDTQEAPSPKPGGVQVASLDNPGTMTDASPDYQVAQAEGGVIIPQPDEAQDPAAVRRQIADVAQSWVGSTNWADKTFYSLVFNGGTNKCFLFVRDVLAQAGIDPGTPNALHGIARPPFAEQWADPKLEIPGWTVLPEGEAPKPGDVVAQQLGYSNASGHVMIIGDGGTFVGTGDPPGAEPGSIEQIPARDYLGPTEYRNNPRFQRGPLVYRRWIGQ